jgi:lipid A ethanolaminephosphotransferase
MISKSGRAWNPELVLLGASVCMLLVGNRRFLELALAGRAVADTSSWVFGGALVLALLAINFLLLALLAWGRLFKPAIIAVFLLTAGASYFIDSFGTFIDPAMLRNALHTHWGEARELLGTRLAFAVLLGAALPAWLVWRLPVAQRSWRRALAARAGALVLGLLTLVLALWAAFQPLSSLMRNQRDLRYLVTPSNVLWSATALARRASAEPAGPLAEVGRDAQAGPTLLRAARPRLVVLVVGETARSANWGLDGYARQTTPELAKLPLIRFTGVTSCGTDTESSLPCMFAAVGRRQYDERRIRRSENLLHVLSRAGVAVHWRDNQSGCKGVCEGFTEDRVAALAPPGACTGDQCFDEGLLHDFDALLPGGEGAKPGSPGVRAKLIVLHQIGNHGPAYHRRAPAAFKRFQPACEQDDLRLCDAQSIVNAYDNALLYTDHVLATLIARLQARSADIDTALIYVSDHGESLGEHGLFLHGMPYAIAPDVQKRVPMVMWLSAGFAGGRGLNAGCLAGRSGGIDGNPVSHDHLFHTVLGLFDVQTRARETAWDLTHGCTSSLPIDVARAAG